MKANSVPAFCHGGKHVQKKRARYDQVLVPVLIVAMVVGIALISYPIVSNWLSSVERDKAAQSYEQTVSQASEQDLSACWQAANEYNNDLLAGKTVVTDPFDSSDRGDDAAERYWEVLNLRGDGVMGTLDIPKIGITLPIYHGTDNEVLQEGVGHMPSTSMPVGGESTHAVLAGHTGLPAMVVFDHLGSLAEGDYFVIRVLDEDHAYRVLGTEVVLPDETASLALQQGRDLVTLVTCTPYGVNDHRLLVHAERCEVPEEYYSDNHGMSPIDVASAKLTSPATWFSLGGMALGAIGSAYVIATLARRRRGVTGNGGSAIFRR